MFEIKLLTVDDHDSFEIKLFEEVYVVDLYYYCLDTSFVSQDNSIAKGLLNFIVMLENWIIKLNDLKSNDSDFLPYDYSDQYIAFFHVQRIDSINISVQSAFTTEFLGWGLNPSQLHLENIISKPYHSNGCIYTIPLENFVNLVKKSKELITLQLYAK